MTEHDIKSALNNYQRHKRESRRALREYQSALDSAMSITASLGGTGGGGSYSLDKMGDAAASMVDSADVYKEHSGEQLDAYLELSRIVMEVGAFNCALGDMLEYVYQDGMSIEDAGAKAGPFSRSQAYRLHDRACEKAQEVLTRIIEEEGSDGES